MLATVYGTLRECMRASWCQVREASSHNRKWTSSLSQPQWECDGFKLKVVTFCGDIVFHSGAGQLGNRGTEQRGHTRPFERVRVRKRRRRIPYTVGASGCASAGVPGLPPIPPGACATWSV
jgi:hypothetical protein